MSCKILSYYHYSKLSYLKRRKIFNSLKLIPKRILSSTTNDDDSSKRNLQKSIDSSENKVDATPKSEVEKDSKQSLAKEKLMSLLTDFKLNNVDTDNKKKNLNLAKPPQKLNRPKVAKVDTEKKEEMKFEDQIKTAVKNIVSSTVTDQPEKMETELLTRASLVSPSLISSSTDESVVPESKPNAVVDEETEANIISAVRAVASTVAHDPDFEQSELTKKLLALTSEKEPGIDVSNKENILGLFEGMKIETPIHPSTPESSLGLRSKPRSSLPQPRSEHLSKVDLFSGSPMNIFSIPEEVTEHEKSLIWEKLNEKELKLMIQFAPNNPYQEMIRLTDEGKHWKFPIDNEIDMGEEENVGFHEHVFLDNLLEGFPKKGPVRHFMELVTTGLSKNPYITVERKKENVEWFRNYFEEKKDILQDFWK